MVLLIHKSVYLSIMQDCASTRWPVGTALGCLTGEADVLGLCRVLLDLGGTVVLCLAEQLPG